MNKRTWEKEWDQALTGLVTKCSFDFDKIVDEINKKFPDANVTKEECRFRWKDLHQQRKGDGKSQVTNKPAQETEGEPIKMAEADHKAPIANQQQSNDPQPQKIESEPSQVQRDTVQEDRQAVERLLKLSARPFENPNKGLSLAELEKTLPKTRTKKDFLSGGEFEFDRKLDTAFNGEKVAPSGIA